MVKRQIGILLGVALAGLCQVGASAQEFPSRLVKLIVPQAPGGTTDVVGRALANRLGEKWKHGIVVENVAGASGAIGTQRVAISPPDGYTLLFTYEGSQAINPHVLANQNFDAVKDFTPIATVARAGFMVVASPKLSARTFSELLALARDKPDVLTYGSAGPGSANHLIAEMIKSAAKVRIQHVPYRGAPQAITDVIGGQIDSAVASIPSVIGQIDSGSLRALAVTSASRSTAVPNVPTIAESGVPGFDVTPWWGVFGPPGMDPKLVTKIAADINEIVKADDFRATLAKQGAEPFASNTESFGKLVVADIAKWGKIVQAIDLKP